MQLIQKQNYLTQGRNHTSEGQNNNIIKLIQGSSLFTTTPFAKCQCWRQNSEKLKMTDSVAGNVLPGRPTITITETFTYVQMTWERDAHALAGAAELQMWRIESAIVLLLPPCGGMTNYTRTYRSKVRRDVREDVRIALSSRSKIYIHKKRNPVRAVEHSPNHLCVPRVPQKLQ